MVKESDNTAMRALSSRFVTNSDYLEVTSIMGLPSPENGIAIVSAKQYSNIFRSLYYSNYLRRPFSEIALSMMTETDFKDQLSAGIPKNVKISHKFGENNVLNYYHDCGIIYFPERPYLLCILSKGETKEEANKVISKISEITYDYISTNRVI
jgi:beta-lactamase class A